jgi:hypothetical protein
MNIFTVGIFNSACSPLHEFDTSTVTKEKLAFTYKPKDQGMEYECLDSHTGTCYFLVRDSGCKLTKFYLIYRETVCGNEEQKFTLAIGEKITKQIQYNEFSICASEIGIPEMPECLKKMEESPFSKENFFGRVTMVFPRYKPM